MIAVACQPDSGTGLVSRILTYVDCQAQAIGMGGYQALASPNSTLSLIIGALLTIFVALLGYRMLLGWTPGISEGVLAAVKVGIVLTLAFSWPAYRTLVYDVFLKGPAELASEIGRPAAIPGAAGGLAQRLDGADRGFVALAILGPGIGAPAPLDGAAVPGAQQQRAPSVFDPFALGGARVIYLAGAIGALAGLRLVAALMLALGPIFVSFLLFEGTRGLFVGWLRVLAGAALGALGASIVLGVELALLEPWLVELIAWRNAGYSIPGAAAELFVVSIVFALVLAAIVAAAWRATVGLGLPAAWRAVPAQLAGALRDRSSTLEASVESRMSSASERSRAAAVAEAIGAVQRRELVRLEASAGGSGQSLVPGTGSAEPTARPPLGQSGRRVRARVSASATRRDQRR